MAKYFVRIKNQNTSPRTDLDPKGFAPYEESNSLDILASIGYPDQTIDYVEHILLKADILAESVELDGECVGRIPGTLFRVGLNPHHRALLLESRAALNPTEANLQACMDAQDLASSLTAPVRVQDPRSFR